MASLTAFGAVDSLIFGSECGELAALRSVAAALDSPELPAALAPHLQKGLPFAAARQAAVHSLLLSSPNNILGIEYLRALRQLGSNIQPLTISRQGAPHDAAEPDTDFPSASQLRQRFLTGQDISSSLPPAMAEQLELARQRGALPQLELWERAFLARLRAMTETDYAALPDVTEGLEHRLYRASRTAKTTEELLTNAKTKRYTHARLRRVLLAAMLELPAGLSAVEPPYLRVLGFTTKGAEILNRAKGRHTLPLSASLAELEKAGEAAARFAALEARAADLYHAFTPGLAPCGSEYTTPVIKI